MVEDSRTGQELVVKQLFGQGKETLAQVEREVALAVQLIHPNIVRMYGHSKSRTSFGATQYRLLMELCPGVSVWWWWWWWWLRLCLVYLVSCLYLCLCVSVILSLCLSVSVSVFLFFCQSVFL